MAQAAGLLRVRDPQLKHTSHGYVAGAGVPEGGWRPVTRRIMPILRLGGAVVRRWFALELAFAFALIGALYAYGAWSSRTGQQALPHAHAAPSSFLDYAASLVGFAPIEITVTGLASLKREEILRLAGLEGEPSLLFVDAATVRARLEATPLIARAGVHKYYPAQLAIELVERTPYALFQKEGAIYVTGADGAILKPYDNSDLGNLPFVVGEGANLKLAEYQALALELEELRPKLRAGILVAGRRWTLKFQSGLEVRLPQDNALGAVDTLKRLERENRILEKNLLLLDFRYPGRVIARLTAEGADERAKAQAILKSAKS